MNPPTMPAEPRHDLILLSTVAGESPAEHPEPCLLHSPGSTVMPSARFHVAGLLPAPPAYPCRYTRSTIDPRLFLRLAQNDWFVYGANVNFEYPSPAAIRANAAVGPTW